MDLFRPYGHRTRCAAASPRGVTGLFDLGIPLGAGLFILSSFAIVVSHVVSEPMESLFGLSLVVVGLPVYYLWTRRAEGKENTQ